MLELSSRQAVPPGPAQAGLFDAPPGPVQKDSPNDAKVAFFRAPFAARTDIYATRIENSRTGWKGWLPAVRGGWQRGIPHEKRDYLPLTADVLAAHLKGDVHIGVYPLLDGDRCWWLAAFLDQHCGTVSDPARVAQMARVCEPVLRRYRGGRRRAGPGRSPARSGRCISVALLRAGVPVTVIMRQLGHSSLAVTTAYLNHLCPDDLADAVQAISF